MSAGIRWIRSGYSTRLSAMPAPIRRARRSTPRIRLPRPTRTPHRTRTRRPTRLPRAGGSPGARDAAGSRGGRQRHTGGPAPQSRAAPRRAGPRVPGRVPRRGRQLHARLRRRRRLAGRAHGQRPGDRPRHPAEHLRQLGGSDRRPQPGLRQLLRERHPGGAPRNPRHPRISGGPRSPRGPRNRHAAGRPRRGPGLPRHASADTGPRGSSEAILPASMPMPTAPDELAQLASTGSDLNLLAMGAASAGLLLGGGILYRRSTAASRV